MELEWINGKKTWCVNIYTMDYYSALKKKILQFMTTWMDIENIMLSEINQIQNDSTT